MLTLTTPTTDDYLQLISIWESAVRATHDFLPEEEIQALKPLILNHYFDAVSLTCARSSTGEMLGFCGVHQGNIEMLFVSATARGQGVGKFLALQAIQQGAYKVDVNEQNPQAIGFYQHLGFKQIARSALDGQGKPYPLLHMQLNG